MRQNTLRKNAFWAKYNLKKTASREKYNGERRRGFGKTRYEKMHFGQNKMKKTASRAKYNGERCRGFGKRHYAKMHCGQNTMKKKTDSGQNRMEKGVEVAAKYITKKCNPGKI